MVTTPTKLLLVFGTRPEAIKLAPVVRALSSQPDFSVHVCVTAQHRFMLDQVLEAFNIHPTYDLDVMRSHQDLASLTSAIVAGVSSVIREFRPDWVIVQGDTTTAFVSALAAFYERTRVAHVEAGLRTGNKSSPFPEEMNRHLLTGIADLHFAPTRLAKENLLREGVEANRIRVTGNTIVDALELIVTRFNEDPSLTRGLDSKYSFLNPARPLILVTGHRRESFGLPLRQVCDALVELTMRTEAEILYPAHLNPEVQAAVLDILAPSQAETAEKRVHVIPPVDYLDFVYLLRRSYMIITDSGGIQEEAPAIGKPVLVTRENTERPEGVEAGAAYLVGTDKQRIVSAASRLLYDRKHYDAVSQCRNPYGDGMASVRIVEALRPPSVTAMNAEFEA